MMDNTGVLLLSTGSLWFVFSYFTVRAWFDWDSASHLYWAFLKAQGINPVATYFIGGKFFLPRLYAWCFPLLERNLKLFRMPGLLVGLSSWLFFIELFEIESVYLLVSIGFVIFSTYFRPQTSSSEWWLTHLLVLQVYLHGEWNVSAAWLMCAHLIVAAGLKFTDIIYVVPLAMLAYADGDLLNSQAFLQLLLFFVGVILLSFFIFRNLHSFKKYNSSRRMLSRANWAYLIANPLLLLWLALCFYIQTQNFDNSIYPVFAVCALFQMIVQRSFHLHHFYTLVIFSCMSILAIGQSDELIMSLGLLSLLSWLLCIFFGKGDIEVGGRIVHTLELGRKKEVQGEQESIQLICKSVAPLTSLKMLGSRMVLPLLARLIVNKGSPYSENHTRFWGVKDVASTNDHDYKYILDTKSSAHKDHEIDKQNWRSIGKNLQFELWERI